jgi:hypothetical protein
MIFAFEEQQQSVSTELEECATPLTDESKHRSEHGVEDFGQFLCTDTPPRCETFRKAREPGYIDMAKRSINSGPSRVFIT